MADLSGQDHALKLLILIPFNNEEGDWLHTALPEDHWSNWIPVFNLRSLQSLIDDGGSIIVERANVPPVIPEVQEFQRIEMTERS